MCESKILRLVLKEQRCIYVYWAHKRLFSTALKICLHQVLGFVCLCCRLRDVLWLAQLHPLLSIQLVGDLRSCLQGGV